MAKNNRNEVRINRVAPDTTPAKRAVPKRPVALEKRVAKAAEPEVVVTSAKPKPVKAQQPAEKRVVAVTPTAAKPAKRTVGKSKNTLNRYYESVLTLDEFGPEMTNLTVTVIRPLFGELVNDTAGEITLSLAIAEKAISRTITGTGLSNLDGERFAIKEGEIIMVHEHKTGGVTIYNTNTDEPVAMVMDARARKALQYSIVPTDPAEFDRYIDTWAKKLEALGVVVQWEGNTPVL